MRNKDGDAAVSDRILGIDIGGSGIKGAPVDCLDGTLLTERHRIPTPQPSTPEAVAGAVAELVRHFDWRGPVGCGMPAAVRDGRLLTAANIDPAWVGTDASALFSRACGQPVELINDADAAGYAEMDFGAGRGHRGVVVIVTLGTGIGTALFTDGHLVPNTELGHLEIDGRDAEETATDRARKHHDMKWKHWARNLDRYLGCLQRYLWPELIIIGGGVSKKADKFIPRLTVDVPVVPARLLNEAGIVGAALAARHAGLRGAARTGAKPAPRPARKKASA